MQGRLKFSFDGLLTLVSYTYWSTLSCHLPTSRIRPEYELVLELTWGSMLLPRHVMVFRLVSCSVLSTNCHIEEVTYFTIHGNLALFEQPSESREPVKDHRLATIPCLGGGLSGSTVMLHLMDKAIEVAFWPHLKDVCSVQIRLYNYKLKKLVSRFKHCHLFKGNNWKYCFP